MARQVLTDRTLRTLKPAPVGKRYEIRDGIIPALSIRVTDTGAKSFSLTARFPPSTNPTRRAIGSYPAMELAAARDRAREWIDLIDRGVDPAAKVAQEIEQKARAAVEKRDRSFETVLGRFIAGRYRDGLRKAYEDEQDFNRECLPVWKGRDVGSITMADILKIVEGIAARGHSRQALNVGQKIGTLFQWCEGDELIDRSPYRPRRLRNAIGVKVARNRVLSDHEIRTFWKAVDSVGNNHREILQLLLLTGQRKNDIALMSWDEIDTVRRTLTIPAERFKSNRDHVVPLCDDAWAVLQGLKRWPNCKWVFTHDGRRHVAGQAGGVIKARLDKAMAQVSDIGIPAWKVHDLRRTVRTRLSELDIMDEIAEAVIGHAPAGLVGVYNQSDRLRQKQDALNRWERALRAILDPAAVPSNVVPLHA